MRTTFTTRTSSYSRPMSKGGMTATVTLISTTDSLQTCTRTTTARGVEKCREGPNMDHASERTQSCQNGFFTDHQRLETAAKLLAANVSMNIKK